LGFSATQLNPALNHVIGGPTRRSRPSGKSSNNNNNSSGTNNESQAYSVRQIISRCSSKLLRAKSSHHNSIPPALKNNKETPGRKKMAPANRRDRSGLASHSHGRTSHRPTNKKANENVQAYKKATKEFKDLMEKNVPEGFFSDTVDGIRNAAKWIRENCTSVDESVMSKLLVATQKRRKEAAKKGDDDRGHKAFIDALDYCVHQLRPLNKKKQILQPTVAKSEEKEHAKNNNRFAAFNMDDSDDDEDKDNEVVSCQTLSINELIAADDRRAAEEFLRKVNERMEHHSSQFRQLKKMYSSWKNNSGLPEIGIIEQLMKAAAEVNLNNQTVASEEQALVARYEHLNTIYRILAVVEQTGAIFELLQFVRKLSPLAGTFRVADAAAFVGDAIECAFHMPWPGPNDGQDDSKDEPKSEDDADDGLSGYKLLDHEFCCRWQLNKETFRYVDAKFYFLLAQLRMQSRYPNAFQRHCATAGFENRESWLTQYAFIGGTARPIMQTIRLLQGLSHVFKSGMGLELKPGHGFGETWDESDNPAKKIAVDLDALFVGDIIPILSAACDCGLLSTKLPMENELLPLFVELRQFFAVPFQTNHMGACLRLACRSHFDHRCTR
jgi:hypothetical protein